VIEQSLVNTVADKAEEFIGQGMKESVAIYRAMGYRFNDQRRRKLLFWKVSSELRRRKQEREGKRPTKPLAKSEKRRLARLAAEAASVQALHPPPESSL